MTAKTTVRYRPDDSPWEGTPWAGRYWEHHCHRPQCVKQLSAWTWHLSWRSALGAAWAHVHFFHSTSP